MPQILLLVSSSSTTSSFWEVGGVLTVITAMRFSNVFQMSAGNEKEPSRGILPEQELKSLKMVIAWKENNGSFCDQVARDQKCVHGTTRLV